MLAGAHKKFYCIQHPEIYLLDLKVQYKHKIKNNNNTLSNQRGSTSGKRLQVHCLTVLLQTER